MVGRRKLAILRLYVKIHELAMLDRNNVGLVGRVRDTMHNEVMKT